MKSERLRENKKNTKSEPRTKDLQIGLQGLLAIVFEEE